VSVRYTPCTELNYTFSILLDAISATRSSVRIVLCSISKHACPHPDLRSTVGLNHIIVLACAYTATDLLCYAILSPLFICCRAFRVAHDCCGIEATCTNQSGQQQGLRKFFHMTEVSVNAIVTHSLCLHSVTACLLRRAHYFTVLQTAHLWFYEHQSCSLCFKYVLYTLACHAQAPC
jgi:hypothetical protein